MDAVTIIAGWKERLVAMADDPPYVFRDTPRHLIKAALPAADYVRRLHGNRGRRGRRAARGPVPDTIPGVPDGNGQVAGRSVPRQRTGRHRGL
jgi:hypothetical protein